MSERTNVRLFQVNQSIEVTNNSDKYLNAGVEGYTGQFQSTASVNSTSRAGVYKKSNFLIKNNERQIVLPNEFVIGMWFKFLPGRFTNVPIHVIIHFDDNDEVVTTLPTTYDYVNTSHYLAIVRDSSGNIDFKIDGTTWYSDTNTSTLDLTGNSLIIIDAIGYNEDAVGSQMVADDIIISDIMIPEVVGSTPPTNYLRLKTINPVPLPWEEALHAKIKVY